MSPVQSSNDYQARHEEGYEGQRIDFQLVNITSKTIEGANVAFGRAVVRGTGDEQVVLPSAAGEDFMGITEYTSAGLVQVDGSHEYEVNREANILDLGPIYVYTETAVVPGDSVFFRHTAGIAPLDIVGRFRNDADTANADQIPGATFESTTAAGGIAKIKLTGQK